MTVDVKEGYKKTKIGFIPTDWSVEKIDTIVSRYQLGGNYENAESGEGLPLIKMGNIGRGKISLKKVAYVPNELDYDSDHILKDGDLLFNTRNTLDLVGKVSLWNNELPVALYNSNLMRLEFKAEKVESSAFMNFIFNSITGINQLRRFATGTTSVAAIYTKDLMKYLVPLPPLPEQEKIAEILTSVDETIESTRNVIEQTKKVKQGLLQELLTKGIGHTKFKKTEIGEIPEEWEIAQLQALGTDDQPIIKAGPFGSALKKEFYVSEGYKIYGQEQVISGDWSIGDYYIDDQKFQSLKNYEVKSGDLLISLVGTAGKLLLLPEGIPKGIINPRLLRISVDKNRLIAQYLKYYLESPLVRNELSNSENVGTMGILNAGKGQDEAAKTLKDLEDLADDLVKEEQAHMKSGLTKTAHGIYKILEAYKAKKEKESTEGSEKKDSKQQSVLSKLQQVAAEIDDLYQSDETAPQGWHLKEQMKKELRSMVRRIVHPLSKDGIENWKDIPDKVEQYALKHYVVEL